MTDGNDNNIDHLKRKKRQLSPFLCQEMLYDYVTGELDSDRHQAVTIFLQGCKDSREQLEVLEEGLAYCEQLAKTGVSQPLLLSLKEVKPMWQQVGHRLSWRHWPDFAKWGVEAFVISALVAIVIIQTPWSTLREYLPQRSDSVVLSKVNNAGRAAGVAPQQEEELVADRADPPTDEVEGSEVKRNVEAVSAGPRGTGSPDKTADSLATEPPVREEQDTSRLATARPSTQRPSEPIKQKSVDEDSLGELIAEDRTGQRTASQQGFVYRVFMSSDVVDQITPEMAAAIERLEGERAGQVELGWRREQGSYFHFSLPESNYEALVRELRRFGAVRIYKDPHARVMPEGQIRFILWMEDK